MIVTVVNLVSLSTQRRSRTATVVSSHVYGFSCACCTRSKRLPMAASLPTLARRACLLSGKRSCDFADSPTSGTDGRTTCTRGVAPGV